MISYENLDALIGALKITDEDHRFSIREYVEDLNHDFEVDVKSICPEASLEFAVNMEGYYDLETGEVVVDDKDYQPVIYMVIPKNMDEFIQYRIQKAFNKLREYYIEEWNVIKEVYKSKAETTKKLKEAFRSKVQEDDEIKFIRKWIEYAYNQYIPHDKQNS